ncbi:DUF2062 domain-containing protein [Bacteroidales bacterium]|nr:DUF2062 domain-containing protein [Bacteroidales bacterium]
MKIRKLDIEHLHRKVKSSQRFLSTFRAFLKSTTPHKIARTLGITATVAVIPIPFINTAILAVVALRMKLNLAFVQVMNFILFPLQIALFIPFMKLGQRLFHGPMVEVTFKEMSNMFKHDFTGTIMMIGYSQLLAIITWLLIGIVVYLVLFNSTLSLSKYFYRFFNLHRTNKTA